MRSHFVLLTVSFTVLILLFDQASVAASSPRSAGVTGTAVASASSAVATRKPAAVLAEYRAWFAAQCDVQLWQWDTVLEAVQLVGDTYLNPRMFTKLLIGIEGERLAGATLLQICQQFQKESKEGRALIKELLPEANELVLAQVRSLFSVVCFGAPQIAAVNAPVGIATATATASICDSAAPVPLPSVPTVAVPAPLSSAAGASAKGKRKSPEAQSLVHDVAHVFGAQLAKGGRFFLSFIREL